MSEEQTVEMMDVDLGAGVTVSMTKEQGLKVIEERNTKTQAYNDLVSQKESEAAAQVAAAEKLKEAEELRVATEGLAEGQLAQLTKIHAADIAKRDNKLLRLSIQNQLAASPDVIASAVPDVTTLLANQFVEGDDGTYKTATGQTLSEMLPAYLEANPHYKASAIPPKIGGESDGKIPAGVDVITSAEYMKNPKKYAQRIEERTLIVK